MSYHLFRETLTEPLDALLKQTLDAAETHPFECHCDDCKDWWRFVYPLPSKP